MSVDPEKRSCLFLKLTHDRFQFSEMAGNLLFEGPRMAKLEWRFDDQKMGKIGIYCAPPSPTLTHPLTSCAMAPMLATGLYRRRPKIPGPLVFRAQHASRRQVRLQDDA